MCYHGNHVTREIKAIDQNQKEVMFYIPVQAESEYLEIHRTVTLFEHFYQFYRISLKVSTSVLKRISANRHFAIKC